VRRLGSRNRCGAILVAVSSDANDDSLAFSANRLAAPCRRFLEREDVSSEQSEDDDGSRRSSPPGHESRMPPMVESSKELGQLEAAGANISVSSGHESSSVGPTHPELGEEVLHSALPDGSGLGVQSLELADDVDGVMRITSVDREDEEREMVSPIARSRPPPPEPSLLNANGVNKVDDMDRRLGSCEKLSPEVRRRRASLFQISNTFVHADTRCSIDDGHESSMRLPSDCI
jgi:hypothetical protein